MGALELERFFPGDSELAHRMRDLDWSQTDLGQPENWPENLRVAVSLCLTSRIPVVMYWGPNFTVLYNDAYISFLGETKHPRYLGQPGQECWHEIWDTIGPMLSGVYATAEATWSEDVLMFFARNLPLEEVYVRFTFGPILAADGRTVEGIFCPCTETTEQVVGARRLETLRKLGIRATEARTVGTVCQEAAAVLAENPHDIPFSGIYSVDETGSEAKMIASCGLPEHHLLPSSVSLMEDDGSPYAIASVFQTHRPREVSDPKVKAIVLPIPAATSGNLAGLLVVGISPRRVWDADYRTFFDLVANHVGTAIADAQAYEAERKRAEALAELDRDKTAFFSNVSHEFRTPLTLMLSPLEELSTTLNGQLQADQREQLQLVQRNGLRLQKLVNTLLDFSRIEAGRVQASYEPTDLATYTAELASVFRSLIERAGMNLAIACPALPELVYVDREMWEKIVLNLISNAFKFTFAGTIAVRLQSVGDLVELSITDTGVGIPEAELPRLFERFHRVSGTRSRTYEGSGIGLALVQELVKLHGGMIRVTSQVDCGTTFAIAIPFGSAHLPADRIAATRTLASTALGASPYVAEASRWMSDEAIASSEALASELAIAVSTRSNQLFMPTARILLADDNADMRDYVKRLLSQYWEVETVSDGFAALEAIAERPPDLVLSDVMMPRVDGFGLLRELRNDPRTWEIPVILLSARAGEESRIEGLEAGADDYLTKPFSARELLARVEATLKLSQIRKLAEAALRESEEQLRLFVTASSDVVYKMSADWSEMRRLEGKDFLASTTSSSGIWLEQYIPTEDQPQVMAAIQAAIRTKSPFELEHRVIQLDGAVGWTFSRAIPLLNAQHEIVEWLGAASDVTQRRQAEEQLRASHDTFRYLVENSPFGVYVVDADFCIAQVSAGAQKVFENVRPLLGRDFAEVLRVIWQEPFATEAIARFRHTLETGEPYHAPNTVERRCDIGEVESYDWKIERITLPDGRCGVVCHFYDLSERQRYEAELQASEERFRNMADNAPMMVWVTDPTGYCTYLSQSWYEFTGQTEETGLGFGWLNATHPEDFENVQNIFLAANDRHQSFQLEYRLRRKDGEYRWAIDAAAPWFGMEGQFKGYIGSVIDISDRKRIEAEREQLLAREQVAREQAESANRIKDEFLAVVSHELRSPLNPILGWAKLLQTGNLDEARKTQALSIIARNAKLQSELIEDLLDISRILRGKLSLNVVSVDLAATIRAAMETVRLAAEAKGIELRMENEEWRMQNEENSPLPTSVSGDAARLQQVVWNLLSNAVKFTPNGGRVEVRLEQVQGSGVGGQGSGNSETCHLKPETSYAQITVTDTGKGIAPDFLPHVFEHFRQESTATTRQFGGLGLGLAIVRHLVELHGGTVHVDSPGEGLGATFTVRLPLMKDEGGRIKDEEHPVHPSSLIPHPLAGVQVLVVDDDTDTRDIVEFVLVQAGAKVTTATTAGEALLALTRIQPDVLLSDIGMPGMDGYMLVRQVRALPPEQGGQTLAIALTAYAAEIDYQRAIAAGFQKHISKPVEPDKLVRTIAGLVG